MASAESIFALATGYFGVAQAQPVLSLIPSQPVDTLESRLYVAVITTTKQRFSVAQPGISIVGLK